MSLKKGCHKIGLFTEERFLPICWLFGSVLKICRFLIVELVIGFLFVHGASKLKIWFDDLRLFITITVLLIKGEIEC